MEYDIIIIGAGPAGYVAAIRAGQLGMKTALIEKKHIGGMCLNWGCIPTKAMIESAKLLEKARHAPDFGVRGIREEELELDWDRVKERASAIVGKMSGGIGWLLKKNGVDIIQGEARINGSGSVSVDKRHLKAGKIIIATGSYPGLSPLPVNHKDVIQIDHLFSIPKLPGSVAILGRGPVAAELALFFRLAGSEVHLLAPKGDFLPGMDAFLEDYALRSLKKRGVNLHRGGQITAYQKGKLSIGKQKVSCELIVNASWRKAVIPKAEPTIETDEAGFLKTDEFFQTSVPGIYAIGDVNGKSYLAHVASAQGIWLVNHFKGIRTSFDFKNYPYNLYTYPEIAQIGSTESQLKESGIPYKINEMSLSANGKALTEGNTEGFIRILSEERYGQVMGVQIVAEHATDMIAEAAAYMQIEGTVYDIAQTIHAHPTVSEVFMDTGFDAIK